MLLGIFKVDPGYTYLKANAYAAWNFKKIQGYETDLLTESVKDYTGHGNHFTIPVGGAPILLQTNFGHDGVSCYTPSGYRNTHSLLNSLELTAVQTKNLFNHDFELFVLMHIGNGADMQQAIVSVDDNSTQIFNFYHNNSIVVVYRAGSGSATIAVSSALPSGPFGLKLLRVKMDFTNGIGKLFYNGIDSGTSFSNMAGRDPSTFNPNVKLCLGAWNKNGVINGTGSALRNFSILDMAVTPILTDQQSVDVQGYFFQQAVRVYP